MVPDPVVEVDMVDAFVWFTYWRFADPCGPLLLDGEMFLGVFLIGTMSGHEFACDKPTRAQQSQSDVYLFPVLLEVDCDSRGVRICALDIPIGMFGVDEGEGVG